MIILQSESRSRSVNNLSKSKRKQYRKNKKKKTDIHSAAVLGLIVLMFAICWLPINILNTITR